MQIFVKIFARQGLVDNVKSKTQDKEFLGACLLAQYILLVYIFVNRNAHYSLIALDAKDDEKIDGTCI